MGVLMAARQARRRRRVFTLLGGCVACFLVFLVSRMYLASDNVRDGASARVHAPHMRPPSRQLMSTLSLNEDECGAAFPGLTKGIDDMVALGPFTLKQARDMGPLQARFEGGQLYIVHAEDKDIVTLEMRNARTATLHQIHRAVLTAPAPLPDTIFSVNVLDGPVNSTWSYSRPAYDASTPGSPPVARAFLMPHFSFWGWPLPFVGSFARAAAAVDALEAAMPFARKDPRAVWRGTRRYNSAHNPRLREDLLRVTAGAAWADVQELRWDEVEVGSGAGKKNVATNSLMIEDFCRYKYVIHTEGITYSGRFQFLQMCGSVLLTPPIAWMQHTTHLVRPLFSFDLGLGDEKEGAEESSKKKWTLSKGEQEAWPVHYRPEEANIVFVAPDWSDLEDTVRWLEDHPIVAEGIARRQRDLFVGGGYFSPAAETCYWRVLIRGWSKVVRTEGQGWEQQQGVSWELFSMGYDKELAPR